MMRPIHIKGMRTTINLRPEALALSKERAQERGISLGDAISDAVIEAYRQKPNHSGKQRIDLPVSTRKGGTLPGVDISNNATLEDIMDGTG